MQVYSEDNFRVVPEKPAITLKKSILKLGRNQGLKLGALMAVFLILVQIIFNPENVGYVKPGKYLIMLGMFYSTLITYKKGLERGQIYRKGFVLGIYMSAVAAITLVAILTGLQFVFQSFDFSKFFQTVDTTAEMIIFDWILLLETFVFGIIITFILLQGLKDTSIPK